MLDVLAIVIGILAILIQTVNEEAEAISVW
jgi:hypothetical protein